MCKWIFSLFHGRNGSLLLWIHKLKSPCVGEELNGGAHSVNSSVLARISAGRFAVTWHYWEVTAVTISSRLVIFCQWKNELAIGGVGRGGRGGTGRACRIKSLLDWQTTGRQSGSSAFHRLLSHYHRLQSDAMTSRPTRHSLRVSAVICSVVLLCVAS